MLRLLVFFIFGQFLLISCQEKLPTSEFVPLEFRQVEIPAKPGSEFPQLFEKKAKLYLTWLEEMEDSSFLRMTHRENGAWSKVITVASGTDWFVNWADFPEIFVAEDGRMFTHHLAKTGKGTYAYGIEVSQKGQQEENFSHMGHPYTDTSQTEHGFVSFFSVDDKVPAMLWLDGRKYSSGKKEMSLRTARIDPEGNFYEELEIDGRTCDCCQTDAIATQSGAIAVYRDRSQEEVRDIYRIVYKNGNWSEPAPIAHDNWVINGCPVNGPAVAAIGDNVVVAWYTAANDTPKVNIAFSQDGGEHFDAPLRVDSGSPLGRVDVMWTNEGQALLSWVERDAENEAEVLIRRVSTTGTLSPPQKVAGMSGARASGFPILAQSDDKIYLAWTKSGDIPEVILWEGKTANDSRYTIHGTR